MVRTGITVVTYPERRNRNRNRIYRRSGDAPRILFASALVLLTIMCLSQLPDIDPDID
jgi:hypothetical protein